MKLNRLFNIMLIVVLAFSCTRVSNPIPRYETASQLKQLSERGILRVVTDFNSTSYFIYRGQPMGYQYEMLQELADYLGVGLEVTVNNNLEEKFELLESGEVDLIAVNLAVTKERRAKMDFTIPHTQTRQVLVQRKPNDWKNLSMNALEDSLIRSQLDLAYKSIYVQRNSSYARRLHNLSDEIGDSINIVEVDIGSENLIEMVARGEINFTVSDENVARVNETYFENIDIETPVSFPQNLAWAVAKGESDLKLTIDTWLTDFKKTKKYAVLFHKYYRNKRSAEIVDSDYFSNNSGKISPYDLTLKQLSEDIGWDWRLLASMVYQESRFNPHARSWAGAFGLMQLMPATAKRFGVGQSSPPKMQMRAGIMFIQWLNDRLDHIEDIKEREKFILASYNVGLGHVLDARALALKNGKNPDIWDGNVAEFLLRKSDPEVYSDPVVKYGYCRGAEPYHYVAEILERYEHYKNIVGE